MGHNRKLVIGAVALVMGRVRNEAVLDSVRDELEKVIIESGWFPSAPFTFISLIIRYGIKNQLQPEFQRISRKYKDLPISIELSMEDVLALHRNTDKLKALFGQAVLEALIAVAEKYRLPKQNLVAHRALWKEA
jgi:hypothetical protein